MQSSHGLSRKISRNLYPQNWVCGSGGGEQDVRSRRERSSANGIETAEARSMASNGRHSGAVTPDARSSVATGDTRLTTLNTHSATTDARARYDGTRLHGLWPQNWVCGADGDAMSVYTPEPKHAPFQGQQHSSRSKEDRADDYAGRVTVSRGLRPQSWVCGGCCADTGAMSVCEPEPGPGPESEHADVMSFRSGSVQSVHAGWPNADANASIRGLLGRDSVHADSSAASSGRATFSSTVPSLYSGTAAAPSTRVREDSMRSGTSSKTHLERRILNPPPSLRGFDITVDDATEPVLAPEPDFTPLSPIPTLAAPMSVRSRCTSVTSALSDNERMPRPYARRESSAAEPRALSPPPYHTDRRPSGVPPAGDQSSVDGQSVASSRSGGGRSFKFPF
ncbi:hypothetical protein K488DRAFT_89701 [Vararia minispora EC-137]|uniref:Uncharacterized protein n=1 Tax=Vararia minispora EC-137 TaxID=1314806 RepID=A0ACB8Q9K2_9AGAM|nr:hypothetical protein K488DRAFT_89701 [Vararia minispora EC-137]